MIWEVISHQIERHYWLVMEGPRLAVQLAKTAIELDKISTIDHGNMTPTLFIPGFAAGNGSTLLMRKILENRNHNCIRWVEARNHGFDSIAIQNTVEQVKHLADTHMCKVNIVGQSLGGCYARSIANEIPDHVARVVTLGSPINGIDRIHPDSVKKYNTIVGFADAALFHHSQFFHTFNENPPVPTTSIYSRTDGVVEWILSKIGEGPISENIEIQGTHFGMGLDINTIGIIANRLVENTENWNKFNG